jgi:hypothetical protein
MRNLIIFTFQSAAESKDYAEAHILVNILQLLITFRFGDPKIVDEVCQEYVKYYVGINKMGINGHERL